MKKGMSNQVFIYIFAIIVIALVLFFGFKQVGNLKSLGDKSTYITFREDLRSAVNDVYYKNKGSTLVFSVNSRNKPLDLPNEIEQVCFNDNKIELNSKYDDFMVENMKGSECIQVVKGGLSFRLENVVIEGDVFVEISGLE